MNCMQPPSPRQAVEPGVAAAGEHHGAGGGQHGGPGQGGLRAED